MAFLEQQFPVCISSGSTGGPRWAVEVVVSSSGAEQRNTLWAHGRHEYNASMGVRLLSDLEALKSFFLGVRGMLYGFRFKDFQDWKSCAVDGTVSNLDQIIGTGDAVETEFQLVKNYEESYSYARHITKPVAGTTVVAVNGVASVGFSVDTTTGIVTITTPPPSGHVVTAGYEFDVPCRFAADTLSTQIEQYNAGAVSVPIIEIRV